MTFTATPAQLGLTRAPEFVAAWSDPADLTTYLTAYRVAVRFGQWQAADEVDCLLALQELGVRTWTPLRAWPTFIGAALGFLHDAGSVWVPRSLLPPEEPWWGVKHSMEDLESLRAFAWPAGLDRLAARGVRPSVIAEWMDESALRCATAHSLACAVARALTPTVGVAGVGEDVIRRTIDFAFAHDVGNDALLRHWLRCALASAPPVASTPPGLFHNVPRRQPNLQQPANKQLASCPTVPSVRQAVHRPARLALADVEEREAALRRAQAERSTGESSLAALKKLFG